MKKINDIFLTKFVPFLTKVGNNRYLAAIRDGISITIPFTIIGSIFMIIGNLPITGWDKIIKPYSSMLNAATNTTFGIIGLIGAISLGYFFSKMHNIDRITGTIISLVCFLLATLNDKFTINIDNFGSTGLFSAIIVSLITIEIIAFFIRKKIVIKLPDSVPPAVGKSFEALIPAGVSIILFWCLRVLLNIDINSVITAIFKPFVFALNTLPGAVLIMFIILLLWFAGIHGNSLVGNLCLPFTMTYLTANAASFQAGQMPQYINAEGFYYFGMGLGGTGTTIGLAIAIAFFAKSKRYKTIGKLTLLPACFGINEPIIFGLPIVLNPVLFVPFIFTPIILQIITWFLMSFNIIGHVVTSIPWTTPPILSGFLVTGGNINAAIWQAIEVVLAVIAYLPFFKILDNQELLAEKNESK